MANDTIARALAIAALDGGGSGLPVITTSIGDTLTDEEMALLPNAVIYIPDATIGNPKAYYYTKTENNDTQYSFVACGTDGNGNGSIKNKSIRVTIATGVVDGIYITNTTVVPVTSTQGNTFYRNTRNGSIASQSFVPATDIVSVDATGTSTNEVNYITIDGTEYKLPSGGGQGEAGLVINVQSLPHTITSEELGKVDEHTIIKYNNECYIYGKVNGGNSLFYRVEKSIGDTQAGWVPANDKYIILNNSTGALTGVYSLTTGYLIVPTSLATSDGKFVPVAEKSGSNYSLQRYNLANKQDTLTAGTNITIDENNVISATGGGSAYTFTNGLTESSGTVSWNLNDSIKAGNSNYSLLIGDTDSNKKKGTGSYSTILGTSTNNNGMIANGYSSLIYGRSDGNAGSGAVGSNGISTNGVAAIAGGTTLGVGKIYANNEASFAAGYAQEGSIEAGNGVMKKCGFAFGIVASPNEKLCANGTGSVAFGTDNSTTVNYSTVLGKHCINNTATTDYAFVIGNGTSDSSRSNALTVDWSGNLVCNNIPAPPTGDGNYVLKCSIVSGVATYSWVSA